MGQFASDRTPPALEFVGPTWVELAPDHSVWGNPIRNRRRATALKLDDAWRAELPASRRRAVSALAWPAARRYGYSS